MTVTRKVQSLNPELSCEKDDCADRLLIDSVKGVEDDLSSLFSSSFVIVPVVWWMRKRTW